MGVMAIMGRIGDEKVLWDPKNKDEVEAARKSFEYLKSKKFTAYRVDKEGGKGVKMDFFDPEAGRVIMVPMVAGGAL